jgi:hypothetical protein
MKGGRSLAPDSRRVRFLLLLGVASSTVLLLVGCGADSAIEPPHSNKAEVAIRGYLADEFLYEKWYAEVGEIDVVGRRASVATTLGPARRSRGIAREICSAVLSSGEVAKASVGFGVGRAQACP